MKYNYRFIARIVLEAETPLALGSGNKELSVDRPVAKDANGIPYIPGTSLAGVIRHSIYEYAVDNENILFWNDIFGFQDEKEQENSLGSRLIISSAHLIGNNNRVFDGLFVVNKGDSNYEFISRYRNLPIRQHVRINHKGVADKENYGKFDEEVVYKGSRFIFEMEMKGTEDTSENDKEFWEQLLNIFSIPGFRIGGGSTKGFGKIKVVEIKHQMLNLGLDDKINRETYLNHSTFLDSPFDGALFKQEVDGALFKQEEKLPNVFDVYQLKLIPEDFYLFSSGFPSEFADMNPVTELVITWDNHGNPTFSKEQVLIPASSVKGAIAHRLAYHYIYNYNSNCSKEEEKIWADRLPEGKTIKDYTGENNLAVRTLFGKASDYSKKETGQKGNVLFSDVYRKKYSCKKLDHVAIDRFTGGNIEGALFDERIVQKDKEQQDSENEFVLEILVKHEALENAGNNIKDAFIQSLNDIISGNLSLGGGTMRGHGIFKGKIIEQINH